MSAKPFSGLMTGLICTALLACVPVTSALAEFFKYKDSSGAIVITNRLEDVPKKYRKNVKVVWDDELNAKDPLARRAAAVEAQRERQERQAHQESKDKDRRLKPSDGKTLVIRIDEETGQVIRTME